MSAPDVPPDSLLESSEDPLTDLFAVAADETSPTDLNGRDADPYPTAAAFPSDPFSEPSPPHAPYPHPGHPSSSQPISSEPVSSVPPPPSSQPPPDVSSGPTLLQVGTAIVIGAMAANVIGFRYSRWAVGKDIHRAWETHQRNTHARTAASGTRRRAQTAQEKAQRTERAKKTESAERAKQHDKQAGRDRDARDQARAFYAEWERAFRGTGAGANGGGHFWRGGFRVEVDPRVLEEMLRAQQGMRERGNPFFMADEMVQEMLRAARAGQSSAQSGARRRAEEDFDPFRFWEQMEGARWRGFEQGAGGGGGGAPGVFQRHNMNRHYSVLGVDSNATDAQIKAAYRKEAMKWHPDRYRGGNPGEAARKFREITEAYNALTKK